MAAQIEAARRAANAAQDAYWRERYWSYGGATGYWSAALAALPASRRTSYECWTESEFSDEFGVRPQDAGLGLVPHQHVDNVKYYVIEKIQLNLMRRESDRRGHARDAQQPLRAG